MNPQDQKALEDILKKDAENLTPYEINFLNARESYLNNRQRVDFASVLKGEFSKPRINHPAEVAAPTQFTDPNASQQTTPGTPVDEGNNYAPSGNLDDEEV